MKTKSLLKTRKSRKSKDTKKKHTQKHKKGGYNEFEPENSLAHINDDEYWAEFHEDLNNTLENENNTITSKPRVCSDNCLIFIGTLCAIGVSTVLGVVYK